MYKQGTYLERPLSESLDKTDVKDDRRCVWKTRGNLVVKEVHRLCTMVAKVVGRFCSKLASIITMCSKLCGQRFSCIDHTWLEFQIPVLQVALRTDIQLNSGHVFFSKLCARETTIFSHKK